MNNVTKILAELSLVITPFLLAIIGYFLKSLHNTIKMLELTVSELVTTVAVNDKVSQVEKQNCYDRHTKINERLNDHERRLNDLEKII